MLAICSLKDHAARTKLESEEKVIIACEFITHLDKDEDFNKWLKRRERQEAQSQQTEK